MINATLTLLVAGGITAAVIITQDPKNARKVAAWLIGRAMYLEKMRAERIRCREMGEMERQRMAEQLEVA